MPTNSISADCGWSSRHFPLVEMVLTYPRWIGREGCDGAHFIAGLGCAAAVGRWWARGQQPGMPVIGVFVNPNRVSR